MKDLKRYLATLVALCMLTLSAAAFDQKQNDPRPPEKPPKDVPKGEKPPPPREDNSNRGGGNDKRGGKPY